MKIMVGVYGSEPARRAVQWCAAFAHALDAEVIAVHVIDVPTYASPYSAYFFHPGLSPEQRDEPRDVMAHDWCAPLVKASVPFRALLIEGSPALAIMQAAKNEAADLVVTGRRGRGGFAELLLGSTRHALSHHLDRPFVIVP